MAGTASTEEVSHSWQVEADLLADGREFLERRSRSRRFRYLYPQGPNLALLLFAYQELDAKRTVGDPRIRGRRSIRAFRRILRRYWRRDVRDRTRQVSYRLPGARFRRIETTSALLERALQQVDPDARGLVEAHLGLRSGPAFGRPGEVGARLPGGPRSRGLTQFRTALLNEALARPSAIGGLHPQLVWGLTPSLPGRRKRPLLALLLVQLPLQFLLALVLLSSAAYGGAYVFFNDAVLGNFLTTRIGGLLDGELELGRVHWSIRLIFDLLTGTPHALQVEDVTVWEAFKSFDGERHRKTAHADRIDLSLVLHEIIPWNRLGIPAFLEIPWVLHFGDVHIYDGLSLRVRQYGQRDRDGEMRDMVSLRDAFRPYDPPENDHRGLSVTVDRAVLESSSLDVDFREGSGWRTFAILRSGAFDLRFEAPDPTLPPVDMPFEFDVSAQGSDGWLQLEGLDLPLEDIDVSQFRSNRGGVRSRDIRFRAEARVAGSPIAADGTLERMFPVLNGESPQDPMQVRAAARTPDGGPLTSYLLERFGVAPRTVDAHGAPALAAISGPAADPMYHVRAEGLTLALFEEKAWTADDVSVAMTLTREPIPSLWTPPGAPSVERNVVTLRRFQGAALDGAFALDLAGDPPGHIVLPDTDAEPYRLSIPLDIDGVNPARLLPGNPDAEPTLRGALDGKVAVRRMELSRGSGDAGVAANIRLAGLQLRRDHGPDDDGLPRTLSISGGLGLEAGGDVEIRKVVLGTEGTRLELDGAIIDGATAVRDVSARIAVADGKGFATAFGMPQYFDRLDANFKAHGALERLKGAGAVSIEGLLDSDDTTRATTTLSGGVLSLKGQDTELLGGVGDLDLQVGLMHRGRLRSAPTVLGTVAVRDLDLSDLPGRALEGRASVELEFGDGSGRASTIADLRIDGVATSNSLALGGTTYRDAAVSFQLFSDELAIRQLVLPIHRPVSPWLAGRVTVPVGRVVAEGTVTIAEDPALDLVVGADAVPLAVVAQLLEVDTPVRGQIGAGTRLAFGGRVSQPSVEGTVVLEGVSIRGISLGRGRLEVTSEDFDASGPLASHREVRVRGELSTQRPGNRQRRRARRPRVDLQWTVDAVMAIGQRGSSDVAPIDAQLDVDFDELSIPTLLRDPTDPDESPPLDGRLQGASAQVLTCNRDAPMLSDCVLEDGELRPERTLGIDVSLDRAWVRGVTESPTGASRDDGHDPCVDDTTLCTASGLRASLDWPLLHITDPVTLVAGGPGGPSVTVAGTFDLSSSETTRGASGQPLQCRPPRIPPPSEVSPSDDAQASIRGTLDLSVLSDLLSSSGLGTAAGQLELDLRIGGRLQHPSLGGYAQLVRVGVDPMTIAPAGLWYPLRFDDLQVRIADGWLSGEGAARIEGGTIEFGSVEGQNTGFAFSGPCSGAFGLAAQGRVSARALLPVLGTSVAADSGGVDLRYLHVQGRTSDPIELTKIDGLVAFGNTRGPGAAHRGCDQSPTVTPGSPHVLSLEFSDGVTNASLDCGTVRVQRCETGQCGAIPSGWYRVRIGGPSSPGEGRPRSTVRLQTGTHGRAYAWGEGFLSPQFDLARQVDFHVSLDGVPYRSFDNRGRLAYDAELGSEDLALVGGSPLVATGQVSLARSRYVKHAVQGVEFLALADEVEASPSIPPPLLRDLRLDVHVETDRPLRIENNIATGVQAELSVDVGGTFVAPEYVGRIEVEPGGLVDIPFLTGTYEIQRGRVSLVRMFGDAEVDVLALRREPVYIEDQPRQVNLVLGGTLRAIRWGCVAEGDASGELDSVRACTEYLVLGTGDVEDTDAEAQRFGGGGLAAARKPLQVVGHLTEIDVGKRIADAAPRIRPYVPDTRVRLGQLGPELEIATPTDGLNWNWGRASIGWDYIRGYPGMFLQQSRELAIRMELLEVFTLEYRLRNRSYINNQVVFDPLDQRALEFTFDFSAPSLR